MSRAAGVPTNYRVVVEPRGLGDFGVFSLGDRSYGTAEQIAEAYAERCRDIAAEIKRHVDGVRSIDVEFEQNPVCEHCGSRWTEASADYNGGCCDADEDAQVARATGGSDGR